MGSITRRQAIERCPDLGRLGDEWRWEERPLSNIALWGTCYVLGQQFGVFVYLDNSASVIRYVSDRDFDQWYGPIPAMVNCARRMLDEAA
ncbi:hypothetical protein [Herbihabitans rhizosphaerae]|nr:hypothetical protein [Herbihabitans rhizosphaerae]